MPRALITGATGLVGSYFADRLLAAGWRTRAMVRVPAGASHLAARGIEIVQGDVLDGEGFTRAAAGCAVIFHAAASVSAPGWDAYRSTNIGGTRNAIEAARRSSARLMHVSSVAVYGAGDRYRPGSATDEERPLPELPEAAWYARSKRESEALVLDAHARGQIWATAIRPDVIYGKGDRQFTPRVARALSLGLAPLPGRGRTTLPIVHAANVADAAVRAATTDAAGGRAYDTANDFDVTLAEYLRLAGVGLGRRIRTVSVPVPLLRAVLTLAIRVRTLATRGGPPVSSGASIDFLTKDNPFTSQRARRELGWDPPMRPETGIPEAFRWWKEHRV